MVKNSKLNIIAPLVSKSVLQSYYFWAPFVHSYFKKSQSDHCIQQIQYPTNSVLIQWFCSMNTKIILECCMTIRPYRLQVYSKVVFPLFDSLLYIPGCGFLLDMLTLYSSLPLTTIERQEAVGFIHVNVIVTKCCF